MTMPSMLLDQALKYAEAVKEMFLRVPGCHQVEAAGSVRRKCPACGDLDMVVQAEDRRSIRETLLAAGGQFEADGFDIIRCITKKSVQIDVFFARMPSADLFAPIPSNWGSVLLCRTGSVRHNIWLVEHAKSLGLRWQPHEGVYDSTGNLLASETESNIFKVLQLDYIDPERRER